MADTVGDTPSPVTTTATLKAPNEPGGPHLLHVTLKGGRGAAPRLISVALPRPLKPQTVLITESEGGANKDGRILMDTHQGKWTCNSTSIKNEWKLELKANGLGTDRTHDWELPFFVRINPPVGDLGKGFKLNVTVGQTQATPVDVRPAVTAPPVQPVNAPDATPITSPAPALPAEVVELTVKGQDASALKFGEPFTLAWRVTHAVAAELWGPLPGQKRQETLFHETKPVTRDGTIALVTTGPMHFSLRATVEGQDTPIVKTLTVGLWDDPRGGRVDLWPQQVLPRGPVACHWSTFEVTRFKFHAITGDVVDERVDAPSITDAGREYDPDKSAEKTFKEESFSIDYGPRAGREWTVEAETEPRGNLRTLQSRVSAIGVRDLQSSLPNAEFTHGRWPYLAAALEEHGPTKVVSAPAPPNQANGKSAVKSDSGGPFAISMAAGRFYLSKPVKGESEAAKKERQKKKASTGEDKVKAENAAARLASVRREWVAVAKSDGLELHVNKLKGERSYKVDPALHNMKWLSEVLNGPVLGVGAAERLIVEVGADDVQKGECVVVVRKRPGSNELKIQEFYLPLKSDHEVRVIECKGPECTGYTHAKKVRVVALWPRVYIFGVGVVHSYDRSDPGTKEGSAEPLLYNFASPDWEVVAFPAKTTNSEAEKKDPTSPHTQVKGGYLFALHRKDGDLRRIEIDGTGKVVEVQRMASANDRVAKLHDLQKKQADSNYELKPVDGRILVRKDASGAREVVHPIDQESVLLKIGGALVVRSEVHDPSVRPIQEKAEERTRARGVQDRAYNPRLNVWVRCGHPFYEARGSEEVGKGALLATTTHTLYCRMPSGEISYISPIEPSHLGFLALDLTPDPTLKLDKAEGPHLDRLYAGQFLKPGEYRQSPDRRYRLTYTSKGNLVLHPASVPESDLDKPEVVKDLAKSLWRLDTTNDRVGQATLRHDANLVLGAGSGDPFAEVKGDPVTQGTWFHGLSEEERVKKFSNVRLRVDNTGKLVCRGQVERGGKIGAEEPLWGAPHVSLGATLKSGLVLYSWNSLTSKNGRYRLCHHDGRPEVISQPEGKSVWSPDVEKGSWYLRLALDGELRIVSDATCNLMWTSAAWGGATNKDAKDVRLTLEDDGKLAVYAAGSTVLWRSGQCVGDTLKQGEELKPGQYLESKDKKYRLVFQPDSLVVLYEGATRSSPISKAALKDPKAFTLDSYADLGVKHEVSSANWMVKYQGSLAPRGAWYSQCYLKLDEAGAAVWSSDHTKLYTIKPSASPQGEAEITNSFVQKKRRYRIRNKSFGDSGNYLFACASKFHSKDGTGKLDETRQVYGWVDGGAGLSDGTWDIISLTEKYCMIYNVKHEAFLYASDVSWKAAGKGQDQDPYQAYSCAFTAKKESAGAIWYMNDHCGAWYFHSAVGWRGLHLIDSKCDGGQRREIGLARTSGIPVNGLWDLIPA